MTAVGSREPPRSATASDARVVAACEPFHREFNLPSSGVAVLSARLDHLLGARDPLALLAGEPAVAVELLTLRSNVWSDGPVGLLDELYVVPAQRGQGIGTRLLKAAEVACRARGADLMEINVDGEDGGARRFYERHGYADRDPGQSQPQLYYSRELASETEERA
ncbi:MAG TPA: GNAT family N-acetyltransferase [Solirubrobacteraceae bacterium]|nr:GNAT family N-acetyltransferase [Solirubrobacteraceae bacterium]